MRLPFSRHGVQALLVMCPASNRKNGVRNLGALPFLFQLIGRAIRTSVPGAFAKRRVPQGMGCKSSVLRFRFWKVPLNGRQPVLKTGVGIVSQGFESSTFRHFILQGFVAQQVEQPAFNR